MTGVVRSLRCKDGSRLRFGWWGAGGRARRSRGGCCGRGRGGRRAGGWFSLFIRIIQKSEARSQNSSIFSEGGERLEGSARFSGDGGNDELIVASDIFAGLISIFLGGALLWTIYSVVDRAIKALLRIQQWEGARDARPYRFSVLYGASRSSIRHVLR